MMRIRVKTHGHQHYHENVGEALYWCTTVEHYSVPDESGARRSRSQPMQVPAVIIQEEGGVACVSLKADGYWTEVEILKEASDAAAQGHAAPPSRRR